MTKDAFRESILNEQFGNIISRLEVTTKENPLRFLHIFKPLVPTHFKMIRVPYGEEIKLSDAEKTFKAAYYAIVDGKYRDDAIIAFNGITDEYFFHEGVNFARKMQGGGQK